MRASRPLGMTPRHVARNAGAGDVGHAVDDLLGAVVVQDLHDGGRVDTGGRKERIRHCCQRRTPRQG